MSNDRAASSFGCSPSLSKPLAGYYKINFSGGMYVGKIPPPAQTCATGGIAAYAAYLGGIGYPLEACRKHFFRQKRFAEFPPRMAGKKSNPSFPGTCASEMALLMTAAAEQPSCKPFVEKAQRAFSTSSGRHPVSDAALYFIAVTAKASRIK